MAGKVGLEPTTNRLTVYCATTAPLPNTENKSPSYKNYWSKSLVLFYNLLKFFHNISKCHSVFKDDQITQVYRRCADKKNTMAVQNLLIMTLLRIITPEEIADIATKHNGGKFLSLTDLVNERVDRKIYRDFTSVDSMDEIHEEHANQHNQTENSAKILPFKSEKNEASMEVPPEELAPGEGAPKFVTHMRPTSQLKPVFEEEVVEVRPVHKEDENMSSFILIEKARLKQSQKALKQKEIISLYQKNSNIDVEQIKSINQHPSTSSEAGVLVNKKQY